MRPRNKMERSSFAGGSLRLLFSILALTALIFATGCGKRYIKIDLDRPADLSQPAWVGIYFLSAESALDELNNIQLSDPDPNAVPLGGGVVRKEVYSLHPGAEIQRIALEEYNAEIRWVVVAAGFHKAEPCARQKIQVKENAKLAITATVNEKCIDLKIK